MIASHSSANCTIIMIIFNTYFSLGDEKTLPIMKSDYKNPCQGKLVPNEAAVSRIRDSHIRPPVHGRYFTTENQDQFTPKATDRVPIDGDKLQRSTVPLGTLCSA